jgi:hypothetical protein
MRSVEQEVRRLSRIRTTRWPIGGAHCVGLVEQIARSFEDRARLVSRDVEIRPAVMVSRTALVQPRTELSQQRRG